MSISKLPLSKETVRTIEPLSQKQTKQVLDLLWKEYNHRAAYVRYLVRARQKLLGALAHIRVSTSTIYYYVLADLTRLYS